MKSVIALTMGDAAGIGPEIILKTFQGNETERLNLLVVGDLAILEEVQKQLNYHDLKFNGIQSLDRARWERGSECLGYATIKA